MRVFRLDGYTWTLQPHCLTVRASWWTYAIGCVIALAVLIAAVLIVRSVIADPSITVGATRHSPGTQISWERQTLGQRIQHLACLALTIVPLTLLSLGYLLMGSDDQRNPLIFDKPSNQLRKGSRVLGTLSATNSVAVVHVSRKGPLLQSSQSAPQIFIRFNAEPWSFQFHFYSRGATADRVAAVLAEFLSVPIVFDPIGVDRRAGLIGRGFPVITKKQPE